MLNLEPYFELVESSIRSLGVDPVQCRTQKIGQWDLRKGSANIWVDVFVSAQNENYGYIQVMAPIIRIPSQKLEDFYRELLETNYGLYGVAFNIYKDWVYLKGIRELADLSQEETIALLNRIGSYADEYDDKLKNKYVNPFAPAGGGRAPAV